MILDLLGRLLGRPAYETNSVLPALRALIHSQALADAVKASPNQIDDFVLAILKALVPLPPGDGGQR